MIGGTGAGTITFDGFDSARTTRIGRRCRCDANDDGLIGVQDRILINSEALQLAVSPGQPDCNEDGAVSVQDRILVTNLILYTDGRCPLP